MGMRTKAHILNTHGPNAPAMYKLNPVNKLVIGSEVDTAIVNATAPATPLMRTTVINPSVNKNSLNSAMIYVNTNKRLTGTVINSTTVTFNSGWDTAPFPLPATSVNNFMFFANGMLIERSSIVSFTQSSNVSTLIINPTNLNYIFVLADEIIGIGKFTEQDNLA